MSKTNWNLILQGNISLLWCQWSTRPETQNKTLGQLLNEFHDEYANVAPLNIGSLLMASYILFVYPQQAEFNEIDFSRIETRKFTVHEGTSTTDKKRFCSRIRNSLTHGRFDLNEDKQIMLTDQMQNGHDKFRATIRVSDLGDFINEFMHEVKKQHFS